MFNNNTYRIIPLLLSTLMFVTSMGFSVDIHYCQNEIQTISLIGQAKSCHEKDKHHCGSHQNSPDQRCHSNSENFSCDNDCCHNTTYALEFLKNDAVNTSVYMAELLSPLFLFAFFNVYLLDNVETYFWTPVLFEHYKPPLFEQDIQSLIQVYLR